jgi:polar amino acid transport system substrate-binding protein
MGRKKDADSASLVKFVSDGIVQLNKSGKLAQLQTKWLGFSMAVPEQVPTPAN